MWDYENEGNSVKLQKAPLIEFNVVQLVLKTSDNSDS